MPTTLTFCHCRMAKPPTQKTSQRYTRQCPRHWHFVIVTSSELHKDTCDNARKNAKLAKSHGIVAVWTHKVSSVFIFSHYLTLEVAYFPWPIFRGWLPKLEEEKQISFGVKVLLTWKIVKIKLQWKLCARFARFWKRKWSHEIAINRGFCKHQNGSMTYQLLHHYLLLLVFSRNSFLEFFGDFPTKLRR